MRKIILDESDYLELLTILISDKMKKEDKLCKFENGKDDLEGTVEYCKKEVKNLDDIIKKIEMNSTLIIQKKRVKNVWERRIKKSRL